MIFFIFLFLLVTICWDRGKDIRINENENNRKIQLNVNGKI